jgi:hypothetical protein
MSGAFVIWSLARPRKIAVQKTAKRKGSQTGKGSSLMSHANVHHVNIIAYLACHIGLCRVIAHAILYIL